MIEMGVSFVLGTVLAWLIAKTRESRLKERLLSKEDILSERENELHQAKQEKSQLQEQNHQLGQQVRELEVKQEENQKAANEKLQLLQDAKTQLEESFKSLSAQALQSNNQSFLTLAKSQLEKFQETAQKDLSGRQDKIHEIIKPVKESLERMDQKMEDIEKSRSLSERSLQNQLTHMMETHKELRSETSSLVSALRSPQTRGRWGEMQLKRVVEMAGMLEYCDFQTQQHHSAEGYNFRPDLVVQLPGSKKIVVDAKTPLNSYLEALEAEDPQLKKTKFLEHARHIRKHIDELSRKAYWNQFSSSPEFVVLFLPGESFFGAALEQDPSLLEFGADQNVIVATPTTLISLLRTVAYGWQQERLAENVKNIGNLGQELYKRLSDMTQHLSRLGKSLGQSVEAYNRTIGTIENRVLVSARKMNEVNLIGNNKELEKLDPLDHSPREPQAAELRSPDPPLSEGKID